MLQRWVTGTSIVVCCYVHVHAHAHETSVLWLTSTGRSLRAREGQGGGVEEVPRVAARLAAPAHRRVRLDVPHLGVRQSGAVSAASARAKGYSCIFLHFILVFFLLFFFENMNIISCCRIFTRINEFHFFAPVHLAGAKRGRGARDSDAVSIWLLASWSLQPQPSQALPVLGQRDHLEERIHSTQKWSSGSDQRSQVGMLSDILQK